MTKLTRPQSFGLRCVVRTYALSFFVRGGTSAIIIVIVVNRRDDDHPNNKEDRLDERPAEEPRASMGRLGVYEDRRQEQIRSRPRGVSEEVEHRAACFTDGAAAARVRGVVVVFAAPFGGQGVARAECDAVGLPRQEGVVWRVDISVHNHREIAFVRCNHSDRAHDRERSGVDCSMRSEGRPNARDVILCVVFPPDMVRTPT